MKHGCRVFEWRVIRKFPKSSTTQRRIPNAIQFQDNHEDNNSSRASRIQDFVLPIIYDSKHIFKNPFVTLVIWDKASIDQDIKFFYMKHYVHSNDGLSIIRMIV